MLCLCDPFCVKTGLLLSLTIALVACDPGTATFKPSGCSSKTSVTEIDQPLQSASVSAGAAIGQHVSLNQAMLVKKIMIMASSPGVTNIIISFFENFSSDDQMTFSGPIYSFTWVDSFSSAQAKALWISLPQPLQLKAGTKYLIGVAPNSNMSLGAATQYSGSDFRQYYRTGTGPYSWGNTSQNKALSIGLEGDLDCF